jgi:hypothetical protein
MTSCGGPPQSPQLLEELDGLAISKLPPQVSAEKGKLTLYADYENKIDDRVLVYLVNRTGAKVTLKHPADNYLIMLEHERAPHQWERAEARNYFSWCGVVNGPTDIADESFVVGYGYSPKDGTNAKVRYAMYRQSFSLASNVSDGFVMAKDIDDAANDALAVYTGNLEFVSNVARGELKLSGRGAFQTSDLRSLAIRELADARFPKDQAKTILQAIATGADEYAAMAREELRDLQKGE